MRNSFKMPFETGVWLKQALDIAGFLVCHLPEAELCQGGIKFVPGRSCCSN
jgi:hypothetical protein